MRWSAKQPEIYRSYMPNLLCHSEKASSVEAVNNGRTNTRPSLDIVVRSFDLGRVLLAKRNGRTRKQLGQFLTPPLLLTT